MALPTSGNISLQDIETEFGAPSETPLTEFLRGGDYVPDRKSNENIPNSLSPDGISLTDFYGAEKDVMDYGAVSTISATTIGTYESLCDAITLEPGLMCFISFGKTGSTRNIVLHLVSYNYGTITIEDELKLTTGAGSSTEDSIRMTYDRTNKFIFVVGQAPGAADVVRIYTVSYTSTSLTETTYSDFDIWPAGDVEYSMAISSVSNSYLVVASIFSNFSSGGVGIHTDLFSYNTTTGVCTHQDNSERDVSGLSLSDQIAIVNYDIDAWSVVVPDVTGSNYYDQRRSGNTIVDDFNGSSYEAVNTNGKVRGINTSHGLIFKREKGIILQEDDIDAEHINAWWVQTGGNGILGWSSIYTDIKVADSSVNEIRFHGAFGRRLNATTEAFAFVGEAKDDAKIYFQLRNISSEGTFAGTDTEERIFFIEEGADALANPVVAGIGDGLWIVAAWNDTDSQVNVWLVFETFATQLNDPTNVSALWDGFNSEIDVSWTDNETTENNYEVQYSFSEGATWDTFSGSPYAANTTSASTTPDELAGTFRVRVRATKTNGDISAWAESNDVTII